MTDLDDDGLRAIFASARVIAVVGASADPSKPSHRIPAYLRAQHFRVAPVSPRGGELFGEPVVPSLCRIDLPVDVVLVFRPADEAAAIACDAVAIGARALWLPRGVRCAEAERIARDGGLAVIMDSCMGHTHSRLGLGPGPAPACPDAE